jgi:uncharacterized membrane protein SirB2
MSEPKDSYWLGEKLVVVVCVVVMALFAFGVIQ